jgi:hypothetical protein
MVFPKCLTFTSRKANSKVAGLLDDLRRMMPCSRNDNKFDKKTPLSDIVEMCEIKNCDHALYLQSTVIGKRRKIIDKGLYFYLGATSEGPTFKFKLGSIHTLNDFKQTGNCLRHSRPNKDAGALLAIDRIPKSNVHTIIQYPADLTRVIRKSIRQLSSEKNNNA